MNAWLAQFTQFLSPYFFHPGMAAAGAALVASPIIIHLINRMRYRRVRFAAMEFLLQSEQRNRRRLLLEQLLLLLLRILIVLGLLALIARLILDSSQMSLFRGAMSHHVVLLDDSGSMRNRWGETTAFAEGVEVVKKLVAEGARRPNTQKFTLLLLSDPRQPQFTQRDVNDDFVNELETKLENLRCSHRALNVVSGLEEARKLLAEERGTVQHLHVVSDFRRRDWVDQGAISGVMGALDEAGVAVNLVRTVAERHANLAVTELSGDLQVAAAGVPLRLKAKVKNFGDQVANDVALTVVQDGNRLPLSIRFDQIEAGEEVEREFDVVFDTARQHEIRVELEADALSEDNTRYLVVDVPHSNPVLVIDGDPARDEAFYVAAALAADAKITGFAPLVEGVDYLRRHPLDQFQCIYMLNVPELAPDALEPLRQYVAEGGGLAWFLGDAVNPTFYNDKLHQQGEGLFPVPLGRARRELPPDDTNPGPDVRFARHPIFDKTFEGQENPFSDVISIYSYIPVADEWVRDDNERKDGVSTIAVLRNRQPLMFEHRFGRGRVITSLSSAGRMWNNWAAGPGAPSYVTTQLELEKYIARRDRTLVRRPVGAPIELSLDPAEYLETVEITAPGERRMRLQAAPGAARQTTEGNSEDDANPSQPGSLDDGDAGAAAEESVRLEANYRETDLPGIYKVDLLRQDDVRETQWFAYNFPTEESDLELATSGEIQERLGEDIRVQIQEPGDSQWIQGREAGQEVRTALLILLVSLLLAEQLLAYRLSYHPKTAGATA